MRYQLVQLRNGTHSVRAIETGETFHPVAGPVDEAESLYVRQLGLRERLSKSNRAFVIWDVGLGAAANPFVALRCTADLPAHLHIVSFDNTLEALEFALQHATALPYLTGFEDAARILCRERRVAFRNGQQRVTWEVRVADFPQLLGDIHSGTAAPLPSPDAIFFDAFSPRRNPEMWALPTLLNLFRLLDPDRPCNLATFSRSTVARAALLLAGFYAGAGEALAGKEETTIAANRRELAGRIFNETWLSRARRSHSAEPFSGNEFLERPLSEQSWNSLRKHPQFSEPPGEQPVNIL